MKNIAIISTQLYGGGAERIAGLLSKELSKYYNVYLFLLDTERIVYEYGGTIVNIGGSLPFFEYAILKNKEKYHIDCAISFLEPMNFANIITRGPERVLISERSVQSLISPLPAAEALKIRRYYSYADAIIACSAGVNFDLTNNFGVKGNISTIYNFINKEAICLKSREVLPAEVRDFLNGSAYFLNIGRLHPQKNQKRLLLQFSYFHTRNQRVKLVILGSGELEPELSDYITELGLDDFVIIIPYTSNPFSYMARAKALVLSSRYEGLPNAVLEAMELGCPVIATDCLAGPRELLMDEMDYEKKLDRLTICKRGILTCDERTEDDGTTRYMAQAMELICSDPNLERNFRQNELVYMEQYTNQQIVKKWITVIEALGREGKEGKEEEDVLHREEAALSGFRCIFIYGAGYVGRMIYLRLSKRIKIDCFAVTRRKPGETDFLGVPIREISELRYPPHETAAIVGVSGKYQDEVVRTLQEYGFHHFIFPYIEPMSGEYYSSCKDLDIKSELLDWYRLHTGKDIDLEHPRSYNEKIQWLKLYDSQPEKTRLSDKFAVREYVSEKIGKRYLIRLLGVWESFSEIDFSQLPNKFALKCTHGSNTNLVVTDKTKLDWAETRRKFDRWMEMDYSLMSGFEMHYAGIVPRIIAEELLETEDGEDLRDYKVFVFNGHTKLIQVDLDRNHTHRRNLYTPEWEYVPCSIKYPTAPEVIIDKPACLDEMIRAAEVLAEGFIHVRVDFYICGGQLYFGEMTFTHGSGIEPFEPEEYGLTMGEWMEIPKGE